MLKCKMQIRPLIIILSISLVFLSCRKYEDRKLNSLRYAWRTEAISIYHYSNEIKMTHEKPFEYLYFDFDRNNKVKIYGKFTKEKTYSGLDFFSQILEKSNSNLNQDFVLNGEYSTETEFLTIEGFRLQISSLDNHNAQLGISIQKDNPAESELTTFTLTRIHKKELP